MRNRTGKVLLVLLALVAPATALPQEEDAFARGTRAFRLGQYDLAIFEYRQALNSTDARYAETHFNLGACYHAMGRDREAVDWFRAALKARQGRYANAAYALGLVLEDLRQWQEARAAFK